MMALQLQRCGERNHDALQVLKPPWRGTKNSKRAHRIRPRAQTPDESLRLSLINTKESGNGSNITKFSSSADRLKGLSRNFVAAGPRYSSLLKLTRIKRLQVGMETRERVFMSISDWVFRGVKDPLVEIDPVTVTKVRKEAQKIEGEEPIEGDYATTGVTVDPSTAVATTSPSLFGYLPPGFPKGANSAALAAGIVLLLAALASAIILALKGDKRAGPVTYATASGVQETNGSVTNGGARQEMEGDRSSEIKQESLEKDHQKVQTQRMPVMTYPLESQTFMPIPQYSTALEKSDLPLPPSMAHGGSSTKEKTSEDRPSSGESSSNPDEALKNDAEVSSGNGVVKSSTLGVAALGIAAELASAATGEMAASPSLEEPKTGTSGSQEEDSVELDPIKDAEPAVAGVLPSASESEPAVAGVLPSASESEPAVTGLLPSATESEPAVAGLLPSASESEPVNAGVLPSASESEPVNAGVLPSASESESAVAGVLPSASELLEQEISVGEEYMLVGESEFLAPVRVLPRPAEPIAALPASADVGIPVDSFLVDKSAAQPPPEEVSSESIGVQLAAAKIGVQLASVQEEVPLDSVPFEKELQAGFDPEVVEERRKEYTQALVKVLPAVSVGAGVAALSSFSGVDGALAVVGAVAAASFLTREVIWAEPRQQLLDEIRNIKSHKELMQFLKDKDIFPESWSH